MEAGTNPDHTKLDLFWSLISNLKSTVFFFSVKHFKIQIIQVYGGSVDSALNRCTHLLCESQVSSMYLQVCTPVCLSSQGVKTSTSLSNKLSLQEFMFCLCFTVSGFKRGKALRYSSLAQHCAEEEEDGSSSSHAPSALQLPPRS